MPGKKEAEEEKRRLKVQTTQRDGMGREEGSGWGTHVYLWRIHFDIWQN